MTNLCVISKAFFFLYLNPRYIKKKKETLEVSREFPVKQTFISPESKVLPGLAHPYAHINLKKRKR